MIISDLNYLENVAEASSVVGGGKSSKKIKFPVVIAFPVEKTNQSNVAVVNQEANSESAAVVNGYGDAKSVANSINVSTIQQANVN
jgi:hypothetical protein